MNSKERVLAAINFAKPDRIPRWDSYWPEFVAKWRGRIGPPDTDPADYYEIDMDRLAADECFFPSDKGIVSDDGEWQVVRDGWGTTVCRPKGRGYFSKTVSSILASRSDLDRIEFEPFDLPSRYSGLEESTARRADAGVAVFTKVGGIYVRSHFLRGEENLLADMATDPGFCDALFDKVAAHLTGVALESLKRTRTWDTGLFVYDDIANLRAPMFSPAMFERYLLPRYSRMIQAVRDAGCEHVFFHSDGNILPLLDLLLEAGFEGFHPLEPRCGCCLPALRERCGGRVVFFGGVCNTQILPGGDRSEIERHVRELVDLGRGGGLIIGSASIGDDVSPETYDYYQSLLRQIGAYE